MYVLFSRELMGSFGNNQLLGANPTVMSLSKWYKIYIFNVWFVAVNFAHVAWQFYITQYFARDFHTVK